MKSEDKNRKLKTPGGAGEKRPPLDKVDFVLLDLDGTLLDKYFDDYFWEHLVPEKYAQAHDITFGRAKKELLKKYNNYEATLNWTDLDFWSAELGLDIPALKEQIRHLIEVHPGVREFLSLMREKGKRLCLVTNAHYKAIEIKFRQTGIGGYFDHIVTSWHIGYPKEDIRFWEKAGAIAGFDRAKERTLFIDDTEAILETAKKYGIKYLFLKEKPASRQVAGRAKKNSGLFPAIRDFREFLR
ncbi:MAG: GMP/IMP nucleotidase [Nitrospiraceae bacterium]|nr:GMP/IMP nucleotidase [Nitrospiraceae bacterium]